MTSRLFIVSILLITPQLSSSDKNASPVYEVINEQARIDDKIRISTSPGVLPYGNPLAGKQNARTHFNNQQAMFNAERIRQLTAQLQRQARGPKHVDSYMQAYHESQDNHQLALEQQQANLEKAQAVSRDSSHQVTQSPVRRNKYENQAQNSFGSKTQRTEPSRRMQRPEPMREASRKIRPEIMRITKTDAKDVRYRNHRSYGSVDYQQYLEPQKYKTVYLTPGPTYDQGVTIKPNGNVGVGQETKQSKLLTEAIPSDIKYVYPKQYHQMQNYKSIQEIQANILSNNLPESPEHSLPSDYTNDAPVDFYYYLKDPSQTLPQQYDQYRYAQLANSYNGGYNTLDTAKDYKPITEEVDDIENPDVTNPKTYIPRPTAPTKEENYKTEDVKTYEENNKQEEKPIAQALHYYQPYYVDDKEESKKYLHQNAETTGVQHLTEDGTGVSAYGDDNVSKSNKTSRNKRSNLDTNITLDTDPFLVEDEIDKIDETLPDKDTTEPPILPTPVPLIRLQKKKRNHLYVTSDSDSDANDDDDLYIPVKIKKKNQDIEAIFEEDYNDYDDTLDYSTTNIKPVINVDTTYGNHKIHNQRNPVIYGPPPISYVYPLNYGSPIQKNPGNFPNPIVNSFSSLHDVLEPVYMITESQLKELMGHNLNIEHLDLYQVSKANKIKVPAHYMRRYKKRNSHRYRNIKLRNNLQKLGKLLN